MKVVNVDDIALLLKQGHNHQTDWFAEHTPSQTLAETLAAFANSHGGTILIGVIGQNGIINGVQDVDTTIDHVLEAALSLDPPLIISMPRQVRLKNKTLVVVQVPSGMPYVYALNDGRYLYREDTQNSPLNPRDLRRLMIERGQINFETEVVSGASFDDLDWNKAGEYVSNLRGTSDAKTEDVLLQRGCLVQQDGRTRPTNAGILLFGRDPQRFIHGSEITAVRFAGEAMGDTFTRQDIIGSLPDQIRRAETFLRDNLRKGVHLSTTMTREESYEYPMEAARELVVNAVAHRDYSIIGDGIRLFIFSNRMSVTSPGGLAGPVTIANIKDERFSRNPIIVQVLSDMGFIERLGYGVDRVIALMREKNLHEPTFEETNGGFRVELYNRNVSDEGSHPTAPATPVFNGIYNNVAINPRQEAALIYLHEEANTRITNSDLQSLFPDVHAETIRRDLAGLVEKNILQKKGQKRGSYYVLAEN
ncbi:MAG: transcriptional regulator [Chloroflexi bacterium]|nr:MAG: transcriptional regulator [Phototrophicales bacterium]RMF79181.1 MAG: transcriptional regulator [Chloroflexota bacterium]